MARRKVAENKEGVARTSKSIPQSRATSYMNSLLGGGSPSLAFSFSEKGEGGIMDGDSFLMSMYSVLFALTYLPKKRN
jgi:hypothetical protein